MPNVASKASRFISNKDGGEQKGQPDANGSTRSPLAHLELMDGWKLWLTIASLSTGLLLSALETSIIATSLVTISSSLGGYDKSNWVATAYLISYTSFLIIFARISDLFGRKATFLTALAIFTIFSLACGRAQSMNQLIIFRAFQGIGGAGLYSLAMAVMTEVTPGKRAGFVAALAGSTFALASVLGPVLGGVITENSNWRWVFYLNVPPGVAIFIISIATFPTNASPLTITGGTIQGIDFFGAFTSLLSCSLLIFALETGGNSYAWDSWPIISALTISALSLCVFSIWQWLLYKRFADSAILPLFPVHLITDRAIGLTMLTAFVTGFPFMMTIIFLPQRLQLQYGSSAERAGVQMLALLLLSASGATVGALLCNKWGVAWYLLVASQALQLIGLGLMSSLSADALETPSVLPGYQVILGIAFGLSLSCLTFIARVGVDDRDISVVMGAVTQTRVLGGVIGIAIGQAITFAQLNADMKSVLDPEQMSAMMHSVADVESFSPDQVRSLRECFGLAFNLQNKILLGFAGASALTCLGIWKPHIESGLESEQRRLNTGFKRWASKRISTVVGSRSRGPQRDPTTSLPMEDTRPFAKELPGTKPDGYESEEEGVEMSATMGHDSWDWMMPEPVLAEDALDRSNAYNDIGRATGRTPVHIAFCTRDDHK